MASNDIAVQDNTTVSGIVSTLTGNDMETRRRVFKAVTSAQPLSDAVGQTILVEHIVQQQVESVGDPDPITGEVKEERYVRTILIGPEGHPSYSASSKGIENSVKTIIDVLGTPARWDEPESFVVKEQGKKPRVFMTLELA